MVGRIIPNPPSGLPIAWVRSHIPRRIKDNPPYLIHVGSLSRL